MSKSNCGLVTKFASVPHVTGHDHVLPSERMYVMYLQVSWPYAMSLGVTCRDVIFFVGSLASHPLVGGGAMP